MPCYTPTINDFVIIISALLLISQYFDTKQMQDWAELKNSLLKMDDDSFPNHENDVVIKDSKKDWDDLLAFAQNQTRVHWSVAWFFALLFACIVFSLICSLIECPLFSCPTSPIPDDKKWEYFKYFYVVISSVLFVIVIMVGNDLRKMRNELKEFNRKTKEFFVKYKIIESYSRVVEQNKKSKKR